MSKQRALAKKAAELEPVKKLAFEDITALGVELQELDLELSGHELDERPARRLPAGPRRLRVGEDRRRQRSPSPSTSSTSPRSSRTAATPSPASARGWRASRCRPVGRRASSTPGTGCPWPTCPGPRPAAPPATCPPVRSTPSGCAPAPSPTPGWSWSAPSGCPTTRAVAAYQPYAAGYFGAFTPMDRMFAGLMFSGFGGFDTLGGIGEGIGDAIGGIGDGIGDMFGGFDF